MADLGAEASWFCEVFGLVRELALRVEPLDLSIEMLIHPGFGYRVELLHSHRPPDPARGGGPWLCVITIRTEWSRSGPRRWRR